MTRLIPFSAMDSSFFDSLSFGSKTSLSNHFLAAPMDVHRLFLVILSITTNTANNCTISGIRTVANHRLLGSVYNKISGIELSSCVSRCKNDTYCLSVNYDFISQYCELNEKNAMLAPGSFKNWPVDMYVYVERLPGSDACSFTLCQNGGVCEVDKESLKMWCRCRNGYKGRRCEECGHGPLGLQDGRIPDISFSASSSKTTNPPHMARLNGPKSWMPLENDNTRFLQIDLAPHRYIISKIAVSGDSGGSSASFFKVKYKDWNTGWKTVGKEFQGFLAETLFHAPSQPGGVKLSMFNPPITSMAIRIYPQGSNSAFRLELYGCQLVQ